MKILLIIGSIIINFCQSAAQSLLIQGHTTNTSIKYIELFKYQNPTNLEFITRISIIDSKFICRVNTNEEDMYLIQNNLDKHSFLFVLTDNINIEIDTIFEKPKISNSNLNNEWLNYSDDTQKLFFEPIRNIDVKIESYFKVNNYNKVKVDSLRREKSKLWDKNYKDFEVFNENYIKKNTDSFISLYLLSQMYGFDTVPPIAKELYTILSQRLKQHSRSKIFHPKN